MKEERKANQARAKHHQKKEKGETISRSRRKALKTIAAGTAVAGSMALAGKWSKPVVDTIILPAHAQATNATEPVTSTTTPAPTTTGGACSPMLGQAGYSETRNAEGFITAISVSGLVQPATDGITVHINISWTSTSTTGITMRNATTFSSGQSSGQYLAIVYYRPEDEVTATTVSVRGPCGDTIDVPLYGT